MRTLIKKGTIVNEGQRTVADLVIEDGYIKDIICEGIDATSANSFDIIVNAEGAYVLPGVIDSRARTDT